MNAQLVLVLIAAACFVLTVAVVVMLVRAPTINPPSPVEEPFNVSVWVPPSEMDAFWAIMAGMPDVEDTYNTILQEQP